MKFLISNLWSVTLFVLMLTAGNTCSQNSPYRIDTSVMDADKFYEDILDLPNRIVKAHAVMLDNELEQNEEGRDARFFSNPLLLNGNSLEYADFSISSKGILTVVEGDPELHQAAKIPFKIYLRRDGKTISDINQEVSEVEISKILSQARDGDHLIIAPVRKSDWKAKRILKVIDDGC